MSQCISHATRVAPSAISVRLFSCRITSKNVSYYRDHIAYCNKVRRSHVLLKVTSVNQVVYLLTLSDDLELQLEGSLRGSRDPLLVTELKDFEDVGPECQPLGVRLLST